mmetsp:Transcript_5473/g.9513  ORF Transcript_5473/g.9513 Transcript_5473/m.9513 type:complete len:104 (+) Transcript_5473:1092-1403(+)
MLSKGNPAHVYADTTAIATNADEKKYLLLNFAKLVPSNGCLDHVRMRLKRSALYVTTKVTAQRKSAPGKRALYHNAKKRVFVMFVYLSASSNLLPDICKFIMS